MALNSTITWEVRADATAGNVNGGGFKPGASGTDWSKQTSAKYNLTLLTTSGASATIATTSASSDMVGNVIHITGGTLFLTGWYEIISVIVGTSITVDRNATSGIGASGVGNIGGALSFNDASDSTFITATLVGQTVWFNASGGTITVGANIATPTGTATTRYMWDGYTTARGDGLTSEANRPTLSFGTKTLTGGTGVLIMDLIITSSSGNTSDLCTFGLYHNCKIIHASTGAHNAIFEPNIVTNCEIICYRGTGIGLDNGMAFGCYIHHCDKGVVNNFNGACIVIGCLFEACVTYGVSITASSGFKDTVFGCTFYGSAAQIGTGVNIATGTDTHFAIVNSIFSGLVKGVNDVDGVMSARETQYNNYYNNGTNRTGFAAGPGDLALNPGFASVSEITGATATTSGSVLTQAGATFSASGVVAGRDYCYISSGTGVTAGVYGITVVGTTTITLDIAPGTNSTADKHFSIGIGHNFAVGANMKSIGYPGAALPSGLTANYSDMGAAQSQPPSAGMLYLPNMEGT